MLLLLRRRQSRRATAGKRRPEALLLLLLIPRRSKPASSTTSDVRRRPSRVVHAHAGRAAHGRPPPTKPSRPRRPRRRVGLRRGASARARDGPWGDRLREQELGVVVSDVGAVLEARVVLVADDRLRVVFERERRRERRGGGRGESDRQLRKKRRP